MKFQAHSVSEFLECAEKIRDGLKFSADDAWGPWFRGHTMAEWTLLPTLYRDYKQDRRRDLEDQIREEFTARAPVLCEYLPAANGATAEWEWYFTMQHFGTPTRLLDWTEGALIALFFALKNNEVCTTPPSGRLIRSS